MVGDIHHLIPDIGITSLSKLGVFDPKYKGGIAYKISDNGTGMKLILERENSRYGNFYFEIKKDNNIYRGNLIPIKKENGKEVELDVRGILIHIGGYHGITISFPSLDDVEKFRKHAETVSRNGFKDKIQELVENPMCRVREKLSPEMALYLGLSDM